MSDHDDTPTHDAPTPEVAAAATIAAEFPLDQTMLIGVIDRPSGARALVRMHDGRIFTVERGDRLPFGTVAAVTADRVHVAVGSGNEVVLSLPAA